ncbi:recombinase family protein [Chloroflexi bacterium TSY]|nr:recombinase family protein [Chloroflexi bacterium TSY]
MSIERIPNKIQAGHLERQAFIYVRQSTLSQVRYNTGSTERQYDLVQRACALGWSKEQIIMVDQDQAQSGASAHYRDGFQGLFAEVGLGHAGAVLSLEVSRLARSSSDWHRLMEVCRLTDTLVIDEEGIYDLSDYNDRILLGFKGAMSEAELHWIRNRLQGGKLVKAQKGELRFRLPTGYMYDSAQRIVFDADEQVASAVRLLFTRFEMLRSALAVVQYFADHDLLFPTRHWGGVRDGELDWRPLNHGRVLAILHNPTYAGAYTYGRTQTRTQLLPGETPYIKGRTTQRKRDDWLVLIHDAHPGYITWAQFQQNQQTLDDNRTYRAEAQRGVVREGAALLQGIVLCGRCGRRMSVRYYDAQTPTYTCSQLHAQYAAKTCLSLRGTAIDKAVAQTFLEAMQPAQLEISLATIEQMETRQQQLEQQWHLRIERAQYEADLARRRFMAVEPENRLVARTLEREWNEKLTAVQRLEREFASLPKPTALLTTLEQRQRILDLAQDLPRIWRAPTTQQTARKQLLRFLIKDVTLARRNTTVYIGIRWQTEAITELTVARPVPSCEAIKTPTAILDRIRTLAADHTDRQIADQLNQEGRLSGRGLPFTHRMVSWLRYKYHISSHCLVGPAACPDGQRGDGRYSARKAAELLNVNVSTIAAWCKDGKLDYLQEHSHGPRWITLTPEIIDRLRKPVQQRWRKTLDSSSSS